MSNTHPFFVALIISSLAAVAVAQNNPDQQNASISGRVTLSGQPVRGIKVSLVPGPYGSPETPGRQSARTDDNGRYEFKGLAAGRYGLIAASYIYASDDLFTSQHRPFKLCTVTAGEKLEGQDIRLTRGGGGGGYVYLQQASSGEILMADWRVLNANRREEGVGFEIRGVADGEYDLVAERLRGDDDGAASLPRRIAVRGADVSGIELRLQPFASVTGKMSLVEIKSESREGSPPDACAGGRSAVFEEGTLTLLPETAPRPGANSATARSATPSQQGDFKIRHLNSGRYRFDLQLPSEAWYAQSISQINPQTKRTVDLARSGLEVKSGEKIKDVTITIASGASALKGKAKAAEGWKLPANLRIHLIPAEKESAEDVLRYFEIKASDDGDFAFNHVAPGKYLFVARALPDESPNESPNGSKDAIPVAWDNAERLKLRRAAETLNVAVELQPCQRVNNYELKYTQPSR